jgi:acetoin utilization deacetylase AcuC-like enzyme
LFNNVALAAAHGLTAGRLERKFIVDGDVHHGDGAQDVFDEEPGVFPLRAHRRPFHPATGRASETGAAAGLGSTRNAPLSADANTQVILEEFAGAHEDAAKFRPQLVLLIAGFDAHRNDPIGGFDLERFSQLLDAVLGVANALCGGRIVRVLGVATSTSWRSASVVASGDCRPKREGPDDAARRICAAPRLAGDRTILVELKPALRPERP